MKLTALCANDIHLGHPVTPTHTTIRSLQREFNVFTLRNVDILFFAGDIFEKQLRFSDEISNMVQSWMYKLLRDCKASNTILRVLHGTGSHDYNQGKLFEQINSDSGIGCDLKYVDELYIEHIEKFDIHVLYVPDEWRANNKQTQVEVQELMYELNIKSVDISIMHGFFSWQTPDNNTHDERFYSFITRYFVNIGHVHTYSEWENIRAPGSFDCTKQGEEGSKGYMRYTMMLGSDYVEYEFIENKYAAQFKTINVSKCKVPSSVEKMFDVVIKEYVKRFPDNTQRPPIFIRVHYSADQEFRNVFMTYSEKYREIKWVFEKILVKELTNHNDQPQSTFVPIPINESTILSLYQEHLTADKYPDIKLQSVLDIVNEIKPRLR